MKATFALLPVFVSITAPAQLSDPGFEEYGVGWGHWCDWEFVSDVPPSGGTVSVRMPMVSGSTPDCFVIDELQPLIYQEVPWAQNGDQLLISFWAKAIPDDLDDAQWMSASVFLGWLTSPTTFEHDISYGNQNGSVTATWNNNTLVMTCASIPVGETPVLLLGGHGYNNSPGTIYLDNVEVELASNAVGTPLSSAVRFRPNPATDKLWVDLLDAPLSIMAVDATGRSHALQNFQHNSRTLELDVSALAAGLTVLRITTRLGNQTVPFLKI